MRMKSTQIVQNKVNFTKIKWTIIVSSCLFMSYSNTFDHPINTFYNINN